MARDPKRINRIIEILRAKWLTNPDLRLCQLITNSIGIFKAEDLFFIEDTELEEALKNPQ